MDKRAIYIQTIERILNKIHRQIRELDYDYTRLKGISDEEYLFTNKALKDSYTAINDLLKKKGE